MLQLVVGLGEVGSALQTVLECDGYDPAKNTSVQDHYDVLHVAFPFSDAFANCVQQYVSRWSPSLTIVHSTVPIGTTKCLGKDFVHSPVRGVHPNLASGIRTFVKFFGGSRASEAAAIFEAKGIRVVCTANPDNTEAMKLWDTTQYGAMICLNKEIHNYCQQHGLDFEIVYGEANRSYNEGYMALGRPEVVRPYLKYVPGKIGGHCVIPNCRLLESPTPKRILETNTGV